MQENESERKISIEKQLFMLKLVVQKMTDKKNLS